MSLYLYCLTLEETSPSVSGVDGAAAESRAVGELYAVLSQVAQAPSPTQGNILAHQAVVSEVLGRSTPLPFRFGTVLREDQLGDYVKANGEGLLSALRSVQGCVEMSIKVLAPPVPDREDALVQGETSPGKAFLLRKRAELGGRKAEADALDEELREALGGIARRVQTDDAVMGRISLSLSCLVERERADELRQAAKRVLEGHSEARYLVSGPWAPYSFAALQTPADGPLAG